MAPTMQRASSFNKRKRWPYRDVALILTLLAATRRRYGQPLPDLSALYEVLCPSPSFMGRKVTEADLLKKIQRLREKYWRVVNLHVPLNSPQARDLHRMSADVWGEDDDGFEL